MRQAPIWRRSPTGRIAVTPIHFDLTYSAGIEALAGYDLGRLIEPAADEVTGG